MNNYALLQFIIFFFLLNTTIGCTKNDFSHYSIEIGEIQSGEYLVTAQVSKLKFDLESFLNSGGVVNDIDSTKFKIVEDNKSENYMLIGYSVINEAVIGVSLVLDNGKFYEKMNIEGGGQTVSCDGCAFGSTPSGLYTKDPFCTECNDDCKIEKTVVVSTNSPVFN